MGNESSEVDDAGIERLFGSVVAFSRRLHATGQRWTGSPSGLTRSGSASGSPAGTGTASRPRPTSSTH